MAVAVQTGPTLLLRPDRGVRPYRLRCRFTVNAYPSERELDEACIAAVEQFIKDMAKQGWDYLDEYGFQLDKSPKPHFALSEVLPRGKQEEWHVDARKVQNPSAVKRIGLSSPGVITVPSVAHSDRWDFELSAVFLHKTLLTEYD